MDGETTERIEVTYRQARAADLDALCDFTDAYLAGYSRTKTIAGSGRDYFVRRGHHAALIRKQHVYLALYGTDIIAWSVTTTNSVLIHLLVRPDWRGRGIGTELLRRLRPDVIRNKTDQSTGDPTNWYARRGYAQATPHRVGKHGNITLLTEHLPLNA